MAAHLMGGFHCGHLESNALDKSSMQCYDAAQCGPTARRSSATRRSTASVSSNAGIFEEAECSRAEARKFLLAHFP
jgi:hypothetical protein